MDFYARETEMGDDYPPRKAAINMCRKSEAKYKVGAVIFKGSHILGFGHNIDKTHPKWGSGWNNKIHAETRAIYDALKRNEDLSGSSIYIYRENELGEALAKPCLHCFNQLKEFGVESIYYSGAWQEAESRKTFKLLYSY